MTFLLSDKSCRVLMIALFAASVGLSLLAVGQPFAYPLDDTYIHLALARTLATTGVWGVGPADPAAASSSPLWSLLLAGGYWLSAAIGPNGFLILPLLLNLVAAAVLLLLWDAILVAAAPGWTAVERGLALLLLWFATPLTPLSLLGMEHVLHLLLATAVAWRAARALAGEAIGLRGLAGLGLLTTLAVAARYEALFLIAPFGLFALLRRRWGLAGILALGAALPPLGFGVYWLAHGGWLLPNALMLKAANPSESTSAISFLLGLMRNLRSNLSLPSVLPTMAGLTMLNLALLWGSLRRDRRFWRIAPMMTVAALIATLLQYLFAGIGWLYRYEAWLVGLQALTALLQLPAAARLFGRPLTQRATLLLGLALLGIVAAPRTVRDSLYTAMAADDRRQGHLPAAALIAARYPDATVLVNDLGMMAYYGRTRFLDLYGLGSNEPIVMRRAPGGYDAAKLQSWAAANGAGVAVLQFCWGEVASRIPDGWDLVEVWRIPRNVVFGDRDIGFFALNAASAEPLRMALRDMPPPGRTIVSHPSAAAFADYLGAARQQRPSPNDLCP